MVGDAEVALTAPGIDTTSYPCLHIFGRQRGGFEGWRILPRITARLLPRMACACGAGCTCPLGYYRRRGCCVSDAIKRLAGMPTLCHARVGSSVWVDKTPQQTPQQARWEAKWAASRRGGEERGARPGETWRTVPDPRVLGQSADSTSPSTCSQAALVREWIRIPGAMLDDDVNVSDLGCAGEMRWREGLCGR